MDFIKKNLQNLGLDDKKTSEHPSQTAPAAPAPALKEESLFSKLGDALHSTTTAATPAAAPAPAPAPEKSGAEKLFSRIGEALNDKAAAPAPAPAPAPVPAPKKDESLFGKIGDALSGTHGHNSTPAATPAPAAPVPEKSGADKLLSKIGETLSGKPTPAPAPMPAPKKEENLFNKIGDAISGRKTPPPPAREENLIGKLTNAISGKQEPAKTSGGGLADKINSALGGGSKAEAKEDKLDKAIDLFQEHVLKEGPQNNESALEQAKDKKIADTIRAAVGREKK